jgi:hypothetical protein
VLPSWKHIVVGIRYLLHTKLVIVRAEILLELPVPLRNLPLRPYPALTHGPIVLVNRLGTAFHNNQIIM